MYDETELATWQVTAHDRPGLLVLVRLPDGEQQPLVILMGAVNTWRHDLIVREATTPRVISGRPLAPEPPFYAVMEDSEVLASVLVRGGGLPVRQQDIVDRRNFDISSSR